MTGGPATSPDQHPGGAMHDLARVAFHDDGGVTVAAISGEVDVSNASQIARAFEDLSHVSLGMVVDLRELVYLDSSGISLLHDLALRMRQRWTRLVVVSPPSSPPRRVLELTALDSHTLILDELEPAIETLRGQSESRSAG
jgi:anti-anti-sigma factor